MPNDREAAGLGGWQPGYTMISAFPRRISSRRQVAVATAVAWAALAFVPFASAQEAPTPTTSSTTTTTAPPAPPPTAPPPPGTDDPAPDPDPPPTLAGPGSQPSVAPSSAPPLSEAQLAQARTEYRELQAVADAASREWTAANEALQEIRTGMVTVELSADRAREEAQDARRQLEQRAVSAYKHGAAPELMELLTAEDFSDLATRGHYVRTVVESDRALIRRSIESRERLEVESERLQRRMEEAARVEDRLADSKREIESALEKQGYIVAKLVRQSHSDRYGTGGSGVASAVLASVKSGAGRSDDMSVQPIVSPEGKVCPVGGPTTFSNDWHAPRAGHLHQGNDLFGQYGTPLVAIADGVIFKAGDDGGLGGLRVWLRDDAGVEYYYAHMARIDVTVGQRLSRGQPVGLLGNSGNARTTPPHLHFQMHPGGGAAVNPYGTVIRLC